MSKVIHLSENAHRLAKKFCHQHGLRMSDWVGALIDEASANVEAQPVTPPSTSKKKVLEKLGNMPQTDAHGVPVVEKPAFWKDHR
jgi:hypothetical protein